MTTERAPRGALVFLLLSAVVGAGAALFTFGFLSEYGTTSGSRAEGALGGLRFAAVPLLVTAGLAAAGFALGRRSVWPAAVAVAVVLVGVGGALAAGAQAAVMKYDRLPRLPHCYDEEFAGSEAEPVARAVQDAFAGLEHPWRFSGGGSTGLDGCATTLLDVTFDEAAAHYRGELRSAGWEITGDDASGLTARRGDLLFSLADSGCGSAAIAIRPKAVARSPQAC
ncbi:hypothetical protein ACL02O_23760 [Micromonospora sp. MS34]|uniref:hypothetical protein n=1 Tax=Micromonospora sp. MS34 TaxID=3385971 RepID=UPI0039A01C70